MSSLSRQLLLHPKTKAEALAYINHPVHALLITGPAGAGKSRLAHTLAAGLLDISPQKLETYPYFSLVQRASERQEVSIDSVRQIIAKSRLKIPGTAKIKQIFLIEDADLMSSEAQNSLLKILEEPPEGLMFILTTASPG